MQTTLQFETLADQWRKETKYFSFAAQKAEHPAYRKIISMGESAVPLILADLEKRPAHWFSALREITGFDPVPEESRGNIQQMAAAWIQWGREQGYTW